MLKILLDELAFYWVADFSILKKSRHKNEWCLRKLRIFIGTIQWSSWEACWIWLWVPCYQGLQDPVTASSDYKFFFGGGGGGGKSCLAVCSTKTQTPIPFNSSSVYWFYQPRCQYQWFTLSHSAVKVMMWTKYWPEFLLKEDLTLKEILWYFCLETGYSQ